MNKMIWGILSVGLLALQTQKSENTKPANMKLNAGIVTPNIVETKKFYTTILNFEIVFDSDWYILLQTPGGASQVAFLVPGHESQQPLFQPAFGGKGVFLTIEVDDVDAEYKRIKESGTPIEIDIRDEPWGDRHFAIKDPNGVGVDVVRYREP